MKHPLIIDRPDLMGHAQRALNSLITLAAWSLWAYLFLPLLSLAAWSLGIRAFYIEMLLPENLDFLHELLLYTSVLMVGLAAIVGWSQYNLRRFQGVDRRTAPTPLQPRDEAAFYQMELATLTELKSARVATVYFDDGHRIQALRTQRDDLEAPVGGAATKAAAPPHPAPGRKTG